MKNIKDKHVTDFKEKAIVRMSKLGKPPHI